MPNRTVYLNKQMARKYKLKYKSSIDPALMFPDSMIESSLTGVFIVQGDKMLYVNPRFAGIFGYTQEELLHMKAEDLVHPDDHGLLKEGLAKKLRGERLLKSSPIRGLRNNGSSFHCEVSASLISYRGKPALMGTLTDLTGKLQADEMLRENDLRYQRLIKYLPEPICVHDGTNLIYVNNAAIKLFRASQQEQLLSKTYLELIHPDDRQVISERILKVLSSDEPLDFKSCQLIGIDGSIIDVEVSSVRIHHYLGRKLVIQSVFRDVTERKRAEEALIQSEKLSLAGKMAAGIAHEIRNPLTALKGFTQLLKSRMDENQEYLDIMLSELNRINEIVQEFMTFAKPQTNSFEVNDLVSVLNSVITLFETQAIIDNVQISFHAAPAVPPIYCDENQLKQVFINILKNALEAMPNGGNVKIELTFHAPEAVIIRITDQGTGISKEQLAQLGNPFYTTKSNGTGLGLMVCYRIIEAHRGNMQFSAEPGKGTTVSIVLPIAPPDGDSVSQV